MDKGDEEMVGLATNYFKELFSSKSIQNCERFLAEIHPCISESPNEELIAEFKEDMVVGALKSMTPLKVSMKDGYPVLMYKKFWQTVGMRRKGLVLQLRVPCKSYVTLRGLDCFSLPIII